MGTTSTNPDAYEEALLNSWQTWHNSKALGLYRDLTPQSPYPDLVALSLWVTSIRDIPFVSEEQPTPDELRRATSVAFATVRDTSLSPFVRGAAIEALSSQRATPSVRDGLIELLEPAFWFFGARGHHELVHSTAHIVNHLDTDDPVVRSALRKLQGRIADIERGGGFTSWLLRHVFQD